MSNATQAVRKQHDNKDPSLRGSCKTQLSLETISNINSLALFWYYLLCQATKPMVLHYPLCRSFVHCPLGGPEHFPASRCTEIASEFAVPVQVQGEQVDRGGTARGPQGADRLSGSQCEGWCSSIIPLP